jgi:hypothetical protein
MNGGKKLGKLFPGNKLDKSGDNNMKYNTLV